MLELPNKFRLAIGSGTITSLAPVVIIYKDVRLGDEITEETESIYISTKEDVIDGHSCLPLLLDFPKISNALDLIDRNYKISNVSLSISNFIFNGNKFSDEIPAVLNAVCKVYYKCQGINKIEDSMLVYSGTIRRYKQSSDSVTLDLEDLTEQALTKEIPVTLIPDSEDFFKDDRGRPYPIAYGNLKNSPVIKKITIDAETDTATLNTLILDRPDREVFSIIKNAKQIYGYNWTNSHYLIANRYVSNEYSPSILKDEQYVYIPKKMARNFQNDTDNTYDNYEQWSIYDSGLGGKNSIISINPIETFWLGIRQFRPFTNTVFHSRKVTDRELEWSWGRVDSQETAIGFTYYNTNLWDPRDEWGLYHYWTGMSSNCEAENEYYSNWSDNPTNGNGWWQPTDINEATDDGNHTSDKDSNWPEGNQNFPVDYVQDGSRQTGIYIRSSCATLGAADQNSGICVTFGFDKIPEFNCTTTVFYRGKQFTPKSLGQYTEFGDSNYQRRVENTSYPPSAWIQPVGLRNEVHPTYSDTNMRLDEMNTWATQTRTEADSDNSTYNAGTQVYMASTESGCDDTLDNTYYVGDSYYEGTTLLDRGEAVFYTGWEGFSNFDTTNKYLNVSWGAENHNGRRLFGNSHYKCMNVNSILNDFYLANDIQLEGIASEDFYASYTGRTTLNFSDDSLNNYRFADGQLIFDSTQIIIDILINELGIDFPIYVEEGVEGDVNWLHSFSTREPTEAKSVISEALKSTQTIATFGVNSDFKILKIHEKIESGEHLEPSDIFVIDSSLVLKYSYSLTKIEEIYNSINVKYDWNEGRGRYNEQTHYTFTSNSGTEVNTMDDITKDMYPNDPDYQYDIGYYNLKDEEATFEFETKYVTWPTTARNIAKMLLLWHCNQHLIINMTLPLSYINLEPGDYVRLDNLIDGNKAFGRDYTKNANINGQLVYPFFFITKTTKSDKGVDIEMVQIHRGVYGFYDGWDQEGGDTTTGSGENNGQGNWETPDPEPDWYNDIIEGGPTFEDEDTFCDISWVNGNNNLNELPIIQIDTNIIGQFKYDLYIYYNGEEFSYGENTLPVISNEPYYTYNDYFNIQTEHSLNNDNEFQGGYIQLIPNYEIPEGHNGIVAEIRVYYEEPYEDAQKLMSLHHYTTPPEQELIGDINSDGIVNVLDIVKLVDFILGHQMYTDIEFQKADVNDDGILNIQDVLIIIQQIL
tara:strand:+ start:54 stop:3668 length:3615 start_codon:yes stop_codon:yes gene_type:complete